MGIAVWLVPPAPEAGLIKRCLMRLPPSLGLLPYTLPTFEPHITIASFPSSVPPSRLRDGLSQAPEGTQAPILDIAFSALSVGDAYFRSVLLDIVPTPTLQALREQVAKKALPEYEARSPRYPHLSLFYVPDEHKEDRERIREALWRDCHGMQLETDVGGRIAFDLPGDGDGERRRSDGFRASEVWIVRCEGPVEEWTVVEKIDLTEQ